MPRQLVSVVRPHSAAPIRDTPRCLSGGAMGGRAGGSATATASFAFAS